MHSMASAAAGAGNSLFFPTSAIVSPPASSACPASLARTGTGRKNARRRGTLCAAGGGDNFRVDRRDVLAGLTGVALGSGAYPNNPAAAIAAEETKLEDVVCSRGSQVLDKLLTCREGMKGPSPCPPSPSRPDVVDFKPPSGGKLRVRRPAHLVDSTFADKYNRAVSLMRALPDDDPCSFKNQAAIHQAYCDGHYALQEQEGGGGGSPPKFDVHFSWIFAPWHRMYIYFYERILGHLIDDKDFALPYWSWDVPGGMVLPDMFTDKDTKPALHDSYRNPEHIDKYVVLNYGKSRDPIPFDPKAVPPYNQVVQDNLCYMYRQMIQEGKGPRLFLGKEYCTKNVPNKDSNTAGALERMAHTGVHIWVGDKEKCFEEANIVVKDKGVCGRDMGVLGTAARDPAFYSHHANVDRLWHLWTTDDEKLSNQNFDDPEWLNASFVFYDENRDLVRIKVSDVLNTKALGYKYEEAPEPPEWMDSRPTVRQPTPIKQAAPPFPLFTQLFSLGNNINYPLALEEGRNVLLPNVSRPTPRKKEKGNKLEVLLFDANIEFNPTQVAKFDVVINVAPDTASGVGPQWVEYAGSFASLPRAGGVQGGGGGGKLPSQTKTTLVTSLELPVDDVFADLELGDDVDAVDVVIVPRTPGVSIKSAPKIVVQEI